MCPRAAVGFAALPDGINDEDGLTWFADYEIRVDTTGSEGPTVYLHGVETTATRLREEAMEVPAATQTVESAQPRQDG
ncbi:hypothetical protein [Rhodococcus opacus]|uniref:hypothetical protein n=1 Tax=Rhodococcus opacus TaxID=37919 RepID=UPI001C4413C5|nr:hypothetical protein [Rhodococcus opacus]MBV6757352.1 hypothetical protein [Rhodococcus opacus]